MSFSFGSGLKLGGATTTPATSTVSSFGTPQKTGLGSSFSLGGTGSGLATTTTAPLSTSTTLGSLVSSTATASTNPTTQTTTTIPSSQSQAITFKVLEDYINKWMSDLDGQEKDFINQATQLNALDKLMIENGEKVRNRRNKIKVFYLNNLCF